MKLISPAFAGGKEIPRRFTCDGDNVSPPLAWSGAPSGTQGFALVCRDPDAPSGDWYHWAAFNIPVKVTMLPEHCPAHAPGLRQAVNDFGKREYGGPCPPRGHDRHHYHFMLYALNVERLDVPENAGCREVEVVARAHAIATAELIGHYGR
jgi:hypothetical protein